MFGDPFAGGGVRSLLVVLGGVIISPVQLEVLIKQSELLLNATTKTIFRDENEPTHWSAIHDSGSRKSSINNQGSSNESASS